MNRWLLLLVFGGPVLIGFALDRYAAWRPRHDLDRLFAERKRERVAVTRIPTEPEPLPHLEPVVA